jgi:hypothetical protein
MGDFEEVMVGGRGIGPSIQAAAELLQKALIAGAVQAFREEPDGYRVRVRKDRRQLRRNLS